MTHKHTNTTNKYSIELAIGPAFEHLPIIVRKHPKSRSMVIRYQPLQHHITLTLPRYVSIKQGLHFVEEKRAWLEQQIKEKAQKIPLTEGQVIPILGNMYTICHTGGRGVITIDDNRILVPGDVEFMQRRICEWIKRQARAEIVALATTKSKTIRQKLKKVTLRDTSSRWGSCSYDGNLSFSWRLIFAPFEIMDYVVSHEVAHLKEHNHSPDFWAVVEQICPEHHKHRRWLRKHGATLYTYG